MEHTLKNINPNNLEDSLKACSGVNEQAYSEAKVYLDDLHESIKNASRIIYDCVDDMKKYHINDKTLVQNIRKQLQIVQYEFDNVYNITQNNLDKKKKMSAKFNITLFGRTKSGKSTLMEILTHGDGSHMGKGGQRTTRDVRSYDWKGMRVTDVPGIDAYEGQEDDSKAEEAAIYADLIIFMITAGQPEGSEADWMVKLKKMDKPIICVCNFKQSIGEGVDDFRLKRLLSNPKKLEERMNISELVTQFNSFLHEQLPNEHVDFLITHLLAKFCSQQPQYASIKHELEKTSRFSFIEQSIINEVYKNGILHRKKCYLSIIDAPLYQQMNQLFTFSAQAYNQFRIIEDKKDMFKDWCDTFNKKQKSILCGIVTKEYNNIRNSIPSFVEYHIEDNNVDESWKDHCEQFSTYSNIEESVYSIKNQLDKKISDIFDELKLEIRFSMDYQKNKKFNNYKFTNWKKRMKWTGTIISSALGIAALALSSGPLGWAALAASAIFSFFSWLCESREDKLKKARKELSQKLNDSIDEAEKQSINKLLLWYNKNIIVQEEQVIKRLTIVGHSMLSLSNGERQLALGYCKNHIDITKKIIANMFNSMNISMLEFNRIICVARVPGRRIAIIINGKENLPLRIADLASHLGNNERINIIKLDISKQLESQIVFLLQLFGFKDRPLIKKVNKNNQTVVYLHDKNYEQADIDSLDLIQQILKIHIILK